MDFNILKIRNNIDESYFQNSMYIQRKIRPYLVNQNYKITFKNYIFKKKNCIKIYQEHPIIYIYSNKKDSLKTVIFLNEIKKKTTPIFFYLNLTCHIYVPIQLKK